MQDPRRPKPSVSDHCQDTVRAACGAGLAIGCIAALTGNPVLAVNLLSTTFLLATGLVLWSLTALALEGLDD